MRASVAKEAIRCNGHLTLLIFGHLVPVGFCDDQRGHDGTPHRPCQSVGHDVIDLRRGRDDTASAVSRTRSIDKLVARALALAGHGSRRILGITGPPGAGKTTLAAAITAELGQIAVAVPMDGFHFTNAELERLGRRNRKGAPDTFDVEGYVALLYRLKTGKHELIYAPSFPREADEPLPDGIAIPGRVPLVITEGNYLLLDHGPWAAVRPVLDEVWFLDPDDRSRVNRLEDRHIRFGKSRHEARAWVARSDESNAALVAATRDRADLIVEGWVSLDG